MTSSSSTSTARRPSRPAPTSSTTSRFRRSALLLAVAALAGCGGGAHRAAGLPAPPVAQYCGAPPGGLKVTTEWLRTSDGVRLWAAAAGDGDTTLVLAHESGGSGLCGWLPAMAELAQHGIRSVAFDFRGVSPSDIPRAEAKYDNLRPDLQAGIDAAGTKHVFLMGASMGGAAAMADGWKLHGLDGIVNLSGEPSIPLRHLDATGNVGKLRVPFLVLAANDDGYLTGAMARQLVARAGSSDKKAVVYPGTYHGWDLLDVAPYRARVYATLLAWLRGHGG